jgi:hypothetical protein
MLLLEENMVLKVLNALNPNRFAEMQRDFKVQHFSRAKVN